MKLKTITLLIILIASTALGQESNLSIFDNLIGKTWKAKGNWSDGSKFEQEIKIESALNGTLLTVHSVGFIDKEQSKLGARNHGVRQYDKSSNSIKFWEFDIFGNLTEGVVFAEGKNIIYQYKYGDTFVTDMWEYVDDTTYNFKVGSYVDGVWKQIYLSTQFKKVEE